LPDLPYLVSLVVENVGAEPRCCELHVLARPDGAPVTSENLRRLPVGELVRRVVAEQDVWVSETGDFPWTLLDRTNTGDPAGRDREEFHAYLRARKREERRGRRRITDDDLRRVADTYRRALAQGEPPTQAVKDALVLKNTARAARWVMRARQEGFLGEAPRRGLKGEVRAVEGSTAARATPRTTRTTARSTSDDRQKPTRRNQR
jgi:hypothetical protein